MALHMGHLVKLVLVTLLCAYKNLPTQELVMFLKLIETWGLFYGLKTAIIISCHIENLLVESNYAILASQVDMHSDFSLHPLGSLSACCEERSSRLSFTPFLLYFNTTLSFPFLILSRQLFATNLQIITIPKEQEILSTVTFKWCDDFTPTSFQVYFFAMSSFLFFSFLFSFFQK